MDDRTIPADMRRKYQEALKGKHKPLPLPGRKAEKVGKGLRQFLQNDE